MDSSNTLSIIAIIGLTTIVAVQLLKDNFGMVEGYGESFADNAMDVPSPDNENFTFRPAGSRNSVVKEPINNLSPDLNNVTNHGNRPFGQGGDFFMQPLISDNASANGFNLTPDAYKVYMATINAATPTQANFDAISNSSAGGQPPELPGPGNYFQNNHVEVNDQALTGRAADLSLCAQNMSTLASGTGNTNIGSTLLPGPVRGGGRENMSAQGFSDCNVTNVLASQTFLSTRAGGMIGTDTSSASLRNANQSIRSDPPNPMQYVGPWLNSTIYPDLLRRPLEGCGPSFGMYGNGPKGAQVPVQMGSGI